MTPAALAERLRHRVIPAALTPLRGDGALAEEELERYARLLVGSGVGGVAVWAHTGRGPYLSPAQRRAVLRAFTGAGDVPVIAGVAAPTGTAPTEEAIGDAMLGMAEDAAELGAAAVMAFPPVALRGAEGREAATLRLHQRLAAELDLPLLLFQLHGEAGGFPYPEAVLRELLSIPRVAGIKLATLDSAMTCQDVLALLRREFPEKLAITGEDRMYGPSFTWGADTALVGIAAAAPRLALAVLDAWHRGDAAAFLAASQRLDRFAMATFRAPIEGYVQRMLWACAWEGSIPEDAARDPFGPPLPPGERREVEAVLEELQVAAVPR